MDSLRCFDVAQGKSLEGLPLPPKLRELIAELRKAGFAERGGKSSHRKFVHPRAQKPVVLSGNPGDDALYYQEKAVTRAIEESRQ